MNSWTAKRRDSRQDNESSKGVVKQFATAAVTLKTQGFVVAGARFDAYLEVRRG